MKTSNIGLFIIFGFICMLIIVGVVGARVAIGDISDIEGMKSKAEEMGTPWEREDHQLSGFSEVIVKGSWELTMVRGRGYNVSVFHKGDAADLIDVYTRGDTLYLDAVRAVQAGAYRLKAEVTMPSFTECTIEGACDLEFSGFTEEQLELELDGAGRVKGTGNSYKELEIEINGAVQVDMLESTTENAEVNLDGAGKVMLTMDGGVLAGEIDGLGTVEYAGPVSENSVKVSGFGSVRSR